MTTFEIINLKTKIMFGKDHDIDTEKNYPEPIVAEKELRDMGPVAEDIYTKLSNEFDDDEIFRIIKSLVRIHERALDSKLNAAQMNHNVREKLSRAFTEFFGKDKQS